MRFAIRARAMSRGEFAFNFRFRRWEKVTSRL